MLRRSGPGRWTQARIRSWPPMRWCCRKIFVPRAVVRALPGDPCAAPGVCAGLAAGCRGDHRDERSATSGRATASCDRLSHKGSAWAGKSGVRRILSRPDRISVQRGVQHHPASGPGILTWTPDLPKFEHHDDHHEPTLIAAARSQRTASSPRGTFSPAELTEVRVITRCITRAGARRGHPAMPSDLSNRCARVMPVAPGRGARSSCSAGPCSAGGRRLASHKPVDLSRSR